MAANVILQRHVSDGAPLGEGYISKLEAARRLGIGLRTLEDWMRRSWVVYYKVGRHVRFKWSEVEADMRERFRGGMAGEGLTTEGAEAQRLSEKQKTESGELKREA